MPPTPVQSSSPGQPPRVLVVDDDATVAEVLTRYLEREGFAVEAVGDGGAALERAEMLLPDLVVLDLMLPTIGGLEVCRRLRAMAPVPIIMLTALGEEGNRVAGLELGADDYLPKPFSPRELTARIKAVLRRARAQPIEGQLMVLRAGGLEMDIIAHEARLDGELVSLTVREFDLLAFLMRHPRRTFTRVELLDHVWGYTYGDNSTVTVHVRRLREKIEADPSQPGYIHTVWGVGYRFEP
ncbi:MAG: response regulator transcription factor [Actinomycetota bacterium]|nr:response regulator transcription factor [Actinomycetota bacterium]